MTTTSTILLRRRGGHRPPPLLPLISRGLPAYDNGGAGFPLGSGTAPNSVDAAYNTIMRIGLGTAPTVGSPMMWALDISGLASGPRSGALLHWFNESLNYWDNASAQTSANFSNEPRDYTVRGHAGAGGGNPPAVGDAGWVALATVTGNVYRDRTHAVDLSAYNWVALKFTDCNGPATVNQDVAIQVNIHDARLGQADQIIFLGDSIVQEGMSWRNIDGSAWTNGPLTRQIEVARPGRYPLYRNGGVPTTASAYGDTNKVALLASYTGKYASLGWGANDASAPVTKAAYKASMASIATYAIGLGLVAILPLVTARPLDATADGFVVQYNAALAELAAADPAHIKLGPDFYTPTKNLTLPLRDGLHPTYSGAGNGYEIQQGIWATWLLANLY